MFQFQIVLRCGNITRIDDTIYADKELADNEADKINWNSIKNGIRVKASVYTVGHIEQCIRPAIERSQRFALSASQIAKHCN